MFSQQFFTAPRSWERLDRSGPSWNELERVQTVRGTFRTFKNGLLPILQIEMEQKRRVLEYIRGFYAKEGRAPSLRQILKKEKLNRARFYQLFPQGLAQACQLASVPAPKERISKVGKAVEASRAKRLEPAANQKSFSRLLLTEEQTKRLLGLSHLEGGKDPHIILDELLNYDSKARKYGLSLAKRKLLSEVLEVAMEKGWRIKSQPSFVEALTRAYNLGLLDWPPETVKYMLDVLEWARLKKWSPLEFANYVTRHYNELSAYLAYLRGEISYERFREVMSHYVRG